MKRGFTVIILILVMALVSCAGGSRNTLPNPNPSGQAQDGINNNDIKSPDLPFTPEEAAKRMPSSGFVPDEVLVKTALDKTELNTLVTKYGYSVESKSGNYARVKVADENLPKAIAQLNREQAIYTTTVNVVITMPAQPLTFDPSARHVMRQPFDPFAGDAALIPGWATDPSDPANDRYNLLMGEGRYWDFGSIGGAHDITIGLGSTIAVIDGGAVIDGETEVLPTDILPELADWDGTQWTAPRLLMTSARVLDDGSFTTIVDDPKAVSNIVGPTIYLANADDMLCITSSNLDLSITIPVWAPGAPPPADPARTTPAGIPGVAPGANYMMIATGTLDVGPPSVYNFTAAEIAASITYAVDNDADVILLGMWAPAGDYSPADVTIMQDAVTYARSNDVIVVAPVGEDQRQPSETDPGPFPYYDPGDDTVVPPIPPSFTYSANFTAADFLPAALTGVISVGAAGASSPNLEINPPYQEYFNVIAGYSSTDASIYATGFGVTSMYLQLNVENNGLPWYWLRSGNHISTAYVGGTLALIYSALRNADPAIVDIDEEAATILLHGNSANISQLLTAAGNVALANNGGYDLILPALNVNYDLPVTDGFVTTNEDFSLEPTIQGGTGTGYKILIDWGDGTTYPADGSFEDWTPATIYDKPGGYTQPGTYGLSVVGQDDDGDQVGGYAYLLVSNPLGATPFATETVGGAPIQPATPGGPIPLTISTNYIFYAGPINLLGLGSETYAWDFGDATPVNEQNPLRTFAITGDQTVSLTIDDGIRPVYSTEFDVAVAP